jgi:hypothetical protein
MIQVSLHKNNKINFPFGCAENAYPVQARTLQNSSNDYFGKKLVHANEATIQQKLNQMRVNFTVKN